VILKTKQTRPSWDNYFFNLAKLVATRSTCLRRQVGAVAVKDNQMLCSGYNGAPSKLKHCFDEGCARDKIPSGERHELCLAVHAEMNLICQAAYFGISLKGSTVFCTHYPCSICAKLIVNSGIIEIAYSEPYPDEQTEKILKNLTVRQILS